MSRVTRALRNRYSKRVNREREETLVRNGMTVELESLGRPSTPIVQIDIGYGVEFWVAGANIDITPDGLGLRDGRLILDHGQKVTSKGDLDRHGLSVLRITTRL